MVAFEEEKYLLELWDKKICPYCGKDILEGKRVGSGQKSKGGFYSLNCFAEYYKLELSEKTRLLARRGQAKSD